YNCQLVVSSDYLILAADLHNNPGDYRSWTPMIDQAGDATRAIRRATGRRSRIGTVLADAGYASTTNLTAAGPDRLIALGTRHQPATTPHPTRNQPHLTNNHQPTASTSTDYATGSPELSVQDHDQAKPPHAEDAPTTKRSRTASTSAVR